MAQLTRKAIMGSFLSLLAQRPFEKITVRDIVEDCGITRNTFYYHFVDVYAVLEAILREQSGRIIALREKTGAWEACWQEMIDSILSNKKILRHIYESSRKDELLRYLESAVYAVIEKYVEDVSRGTGASESDRKLLAAFYRYALTGFFLDWIRDGMRDDAVGLLKRLGALLDGGLELALQKSAENPSP